MEPIDDDRVVPLHSFKHAATLQHMLPGNPHPLLVRIDKKAGHGAGKSTDKKYVFIARYRRIPADAWPIESRRLRIDLVSWHNPWVCKRDMVDRRRSICGHCYVELPLQRVLWVIGFDMIPSRASTGMRRKYVISSELSPRTLIHALMIEVRNIQSKPAVSKMIEASEPSRHGCRSEIRIIRRSLRALIAKRGRWL